MSAAVDPARLRIIANTADDVERHGLYVSPDVDTLLYTLAGIVDPVQGWGIKGDTFAALDALGRLGEETWFRLGDRDMATHLVRTCLRAQGWTATAITRFLAVRLNVTAEILPMTDQPVYTEVRTPQGWMHFQEFFVKHACRMDILDVRVHGIMTAGTTDAVVSAIQESPLIIICPSNPVASIGPILALKRVREAVAQSRATRIAISPIVGGKSLKGPADRMLVAKGFSADALGVARFYKGFIDGIVIDRLDACLKSAIESEGIQVLVTDTIMKGPSADPDLARASLEFAERLDRRKADKICIVVPVKNPLGAKQRLAEVLSPEHRHELALALLDHVLNTLNPFLTRATVLVVTDSDEILERVRALGVQTLMEKSGRGETEAVNAATRWSLKNGFTRQIVIPGDLPCLSGRDIERLLSEPIQAPSVVLCPATGDDGTNAILTSPPDVLEFRFGARSFPDYVERAAKKNVPCKILRLESLVLDLDTPEDLKTFVDGSRDGDQAAPPLRRLIESWMPASMGAHHG